MHHFKHSDIRVGEGKVPRWLIVAALGLIAWAVIYLVLYL
ncbi:MAG: cbb3-type cytochrome c oxidase N-terminal domain-containing protein [Nitrospinota bacterium]